MSKNRDTDLHVGSSLFLYGAIFIGGGMVAWIIFYKTIAIAFFALAVLCIAAGQAFKKSSDLKNNNIYGEK